MRWRTRASAYLDDFEKYPEGHTSPSAEFTPAKAGGTRRPESLRRMKKIRLTPDGLAHLASGAVFKAVLNLQG